MKLTKVQMIISICVGLFILLPTTYYGIISIGNTIEEISDNTRFRFEQKLERLESRLWHLEIQFPEGAAYPPGHVEKIIRLDNEITALEIKLGYIKGE